VLASAAESRLNPVMLVPLTANFAVPTLLLESVAVIVTLPVSPAGMVMYAMNCPPDARSEAGEVVTI